MRFAAQTNATRRITQLTCHKMARIWRPREAGDIILDAAERPQQGQRSNLVTPPRSSPDLEFPTHAGSDEPVVGAEADGADLGESAGAGGRASKDDGFSIKA